MTPPRRPEQLYLRGVPTGPYLCVGCGCRRARRPGRPRKPAAWYCPTCVDVAEEHLELRARAVATVQLGQWTDHPLQAPAVARRWARAYNLGAVLDMERDARRVAMAVAGRVVRSLGHRVRWSVLRAVSKQVAAEVVARWARLRGGA